MSLTQIKDKFYKKNPEAIAYIAYNEKLNKYICYVYNVLKDVKQIIDKKEVSNIMTQKKLDYLSAVVSYIEKTNINMYEYFSDFFADVYGNAPEKYPDLDSFCDEFNSYLNIVMGKGNYNTTSTPTIYAYVLNNDGEIEGTPIFDMDLTIKSNRYGVKSCTIENTFTNDEYKCAGIHGLGIRFLEAVLAEKNIHLIQGKSQECDVYESSNNSTLIEHYKKLGFDVDYEEDGSYTIFKCVDPDSTLDISKPEPTAIR